MKQLFLISFFGLLMAHAHDHHPKNSRPMPPWQKSTSIQGINTLTHCQIKKVDAIGHLKTIHCTFNTLHFIGSAQLQQTHIKFSTQGYGSITATDTHFKGPIKLHGNQMHLNHSQAEAINLYSSKAKPGCIYLTHQSTVQGPITFSPQQGTVFVDQSSHIKGKIIGGHSAPFKTNQGDHSS